MLNIKGAIFRLTKSGNKIHIDTSQRGLCAEKKEFGLPASFARRYWNTRNTERLLWTEKVAQKQNI